MATNFEVNLDNSGRIIGYFPDGNLDNLILPEKMTDYMDGGERVIHKGVEHDLLPGGSLAHPDVDVIPYVDLGSGALLEKGTKFHEWELDPEKGRIDIADGVRIKGADIYPRVRIGKKGLILAKEVNTFSILGEYVRLGEGTSIGSSVIFEDAVKTDRDVQVGIGVVVGFGTKIGYKAQIGSHARIARNLKLGKFTGEGPRGNNQDGIFVASGQIVTRNLLN